MRVTEIIDILINLNLPDDYDIVICTKEGYSEPFKFTADDETETVFVHAD